MKNWIILLAILTIFTTNLYAQIDALGISIGNNFASHTHFNPIFPEDGQTQWDTYFGINIGIYAHKNFTKRWGLRSAINYQKKGYAGLFLRSAPASLTNSYRLYTLQHKLTYLTLSVFSDFVLNPKHKNLKLAFFFGVEPNFFIKQQTASDSRYFIANLPPDIQHENDWNKYHLNYNLGFRLNVYELIGISAFFNRSLSPVFETENLIVKDWIWGISLDVNILDILKE